MSDKFAACSGVVEIVKNEIVWRLTPDEATELADFIEESVSSGDMAMDDVRALRAAVEVLS